MYRHHITAKEQKCKELDAEIEDVMLQFKQDDAMLRQRLDHELGEANTKLQEMEQKLSKAQQEAETAKEELMKREDTTVEKRERKVAEFETKYRTDKYIEELEDRVNFAEQKSTRYLEELRRLQNSASLDSTICQLQGEAFFYFLILCITK